ncbi:HlyD family efflux transporter periplasmic adaptor subunit [Xanthomonas sp. AmX2]|uniref:HlyD family secretion protein n=1 Tax=Xanthomonas sp. TaxID=29446 RepID=UPI00197DDE0D|nr:HlyD family efflux transporter periplasmic adaptor subunit [Xanthomonas sp.]MBN6151220.1 HlyD family efflux transporter periplasmic adaptor subunit [Xanthomonas sp.]
MNPSIATRGLPWALAAALLGGCQAAPPQAAGTLEWDRIGVPAPAAERIVRIDVREGQRVQAGTALLQLEPDRTQAQLDAARAQVAQSRGLLDERVAGPRQEAIAQARANLAAVQAQAVDADAYYRRLQPLGARQLVAAADVDRARAAAAQSQAQARAAQQALQELLHGTRSEQLQQGEAALSAAAAQAAGQALTLERLSLVAPRAGRVDSLPYKLGDQAPVGAALAILLVGDAPYARVYVPEPLRAGVQVGQRAQVYVGGGERAYPGRVRMIRSEPVFTPYYALSGDDAERLSYLAEVQLDAGAAQLPAGLPVRVRFADGADE